VQPEDYFAWRPEVTKANGSSVPATGFLGQDAMGAIVSALLYAIKPIWHMDWEPEISLRVIHNPSAVVPLLRNILLRRCAQLVAAGTEADEIAGWVLTQIAKMVLWTSDNPLPIKPRTACRTSNRKCSFC
jgi:hypothetical protein